MRSVQLGTARVGSTDDTEMIESLCHMCQWDPRVKVGRRFPKDKRHAVGIPLEEGARAVIAIDILARLHKPRPSFHVIRCFRRATVAIHAGRGFDS